MTTFLKEDVEAVTLVYPECLTAQVADGWQT